MVARIIPTQNRQDDVLSQLLECSFRGISFPVESLLTEFQHSVIQHRRMDRNGAKLENTGRGPISYTIRAPFCNTIARGPSETWDNLFPDTKNRFLEALEDRSTGDFVHPEFGLRRCKVGPVKENLDPNFRSGVVLEFSLIEDTEEGDATSIIVNAVVDIAQNSAISLDAALGQLNPPIDTGLGELGFSDFEDAIRFVTGIFDQIGLMQKQVIGKIDRLIGKVNDLFDKAGGSIEDLGTFPDQLVSSLIEIKHNILTQSKPLGTYQVLQKMSIGQLATLLNSNSVDLITLNPLLAGSIIVPKFTLVRYYTS